MVTMRFFPTTALILFLTELVTIAHVRAFTSLYYQVPTRPGQSPQELQWLIPTKSSTTSSYMTTPPPRLHMALRTVGGSSPRRFSIWSNLDVTHLLQRRSVATSFSTSESSTPDVVIREFERREAAIEKRREAALAELSKYENSLEALRNKKKEYVAASQMTKPPVGGTFSETAVRSAVKAFCWRLLAGSITFMTTLKFSGSLTTAIQVVSADFFSKAFTMFLGERLMNKTQAGRKAGSDVASRSLAKALIWRLFAVTNTLIMAVFVSKDLSVASKIASTDAVFKTALMFFYERVWARVDWGKEYLIEFSI